MDDHQTFAAVEAVFNATCRRDGIRIPPHMQAEVSLELALLSQHLAIVGDASLEAIEPMAVVDAAQEAQA